MGETSTWHRFSGVSCPCLQQRKAGRHRESSEQCNHYPSPDPSCHPSQYHSSTFVCANSMCPTAQSQNLLLLSCVCKPREDSPGYTGPLICSVLASFSQALARCAVGINPVVSCLEPDFLRASSPYSSLSVKQGCHILSSVKVIDCCGVSCSSTALNFDSCHRVRAKQLE